MNLPLPTDARDDRLDALRGVAMVWMTVFHFSFDLQHQGFFKANFYEDPFWTLQRTCIVSLFLLCAGVGQAVAVSQGQGWPRFWRRWAQIAGCALLVSAGSWFMFPRSYISFGVLHGMAVMLIVLRLLLPRLGQGALLALALACLLVPVWARHPVFDTRWTNWVGLVTHKPVTEDYVPVLPWLGVMLLGAALARWVAPRLGPPRPSGRLRGGLALLGRWSLSYYMVHQPVLIGALMLWQMR
ncbi:heparan-alpha-glucosaminide N-acetyltransferase [Pelomonas sp. APW6]|uniref:Heparan-alpha-glucosaminide N-acetyltransferase n=1 Tax=Roseateles subflavus TaxID=3053353 RepID=A0ABT7LK53_9BURK|nr:heparan-alpha-glucosaminide N-acetyltransferase [Pelomonas sp. APW6]MDL5033246.1 heparan-alpha-glucosaminide N-acetyltransferase [Pelomonas sp. APW6]